MTGGDEVPKELVRLWSALARELNLPEEDGRRLARLTWRLLAGGSLSYENASTAVGDDLLLLAHDMGLIVPSRPGARGLASHSIQRAPGTKLELNPAAGAAFRALMAGGDVLEGLASLLSELGLGGHLSLRVAEVALELSAKRVVSGSEVASACRSHGLAGLESQAIAILKAAGVLSPILSVSWPSGDVRYRTCYILSLLTRAVL